VRSLDLSADGKSMLLTSRDSEVMLFDLADYSMRRLYFQTRRAKWTPDGKQAACVRFDSAVDVIDIPSGKKVQRCAGHQGEVHSLSFSRDGSRLLSAGRADGTVRLWDVQQGKQLHRWDLKAEAVLLSSDGHTVFAGDAAGKLHRFDAVTGKELSPLLGHQAAIRAIRGSQDGKRIVSVDSARGTLVWDVVTGKERRLDLKQEGLGAVALSADGRCLATSPFREGTILLWDVANGK
jgi:WD40 repeat protein